MNHRWAGLGQVGRQVAMAAVVALCLSAAAQAGGLEAKFGPAGVESLTYNGTEFVAPGEGGPVVNSVFLQRPEKKGSGAPLTKGKASFDAASATLTTEYAWGSIAFAYKVAGDRLDVRIKISNATDPNASEVIDGADMTVLKLLLPDERSTPGGVSLGFKNVKCPTAQVVLCDWEVKDPIALSVAARGGKDQGFGVRLNVPQSAQPVHPIVADHWFTVNGRKAAAGQSQEFHVSLNFGPADAPLEKVCGDFLEHSRAQRPMSLNWPDRRPIGCIFLCNPMTGWKTNPRGYLFGKGQKNDVTTPEGLAEFKTDLLKYADSCIKVLKEGNCQGVIIWDLEGAEFWHPMTYIGNPQSLAMVSPEMEQCADEFFKKFTDAGLKVGLTIRPTEIIANKKTYVRFWHRDVLDPAALMALKIDYAKKRWGCTIFYLDSNVFGPGWDLEVKGVPWTLPTKMIEEINKQHPDVLVIPEWENPDYYAYSAPYKSCNIGQIATNSVAQIVWPAAFSVAMANTRTMEESWDAYVAAVTRGDVLFWTGWYLSPENQMVRMIYQEAGYIKAGPGQAVAGADLAALLKLVESAEAATRYHAAKALGKIKDPQAAGALDKLLTDESLLVRRAALVALASAGPVGDAKIIDDLLAIVKDKKADNGFLRIFAARALGAAGDAAVGPLTEMIASKDAAALLPYTILALGATGTADPNAAEVLMPTLDSKDSYLKTQAAKALGSLKAKAAVDKLIALLEDPDEQVSVMAVWALGEIGDIKAVTPLINHFDHGYRTVVVYRIANTQNDALKHLTGQKLVGKAAWFAYWKQNNPTQPASSEPSSSTP